MTGDVLPSHILEYILILNKEKKTIDEIIHSIQEKFNLTYSFSIITNALISNNEFHEDDVISKIHNRVNKTVQADNYLELLESKKFQLIILYELGASPRDIFDQLYKYNLGSGSETTDRMMIRIRLQDWGCKMYSRKEKRLKTIDDRKEMITKKYDIDRERIDTIIAKYELGNL